MPPSILTFILLSTEKQAVHISIHILVPLVFGFEMIAEVLMQFSAWWTKVF